MKILILIVCIVLVSSCGGGSRGSNNSSSSNSVSITEIGIFNGSSLTTTVKKDSEIFSGIKVSNNTEELFSGFFEMNISTSCEGINPWVIREVQQLQIEPGTSSVYVSSRSCPDLVATTTQLIAKIYGPDQAELVDMEAYDFTIN